MAPKRRRLLSRSSSTGLTKKQTVSNKKATLIARHAGPWLPADERNAVNQIANGDPLYKVALKYGVSKLQKHVLPALKAHGDKANAKAALNRSNSSGPQKKRQYMPPTNLGIPNVGSALLRDVSNAPSSISMSRSRSSSFNSTVSNSFQNDMFGSAKRGRKTRIFPTKRKAGKAQRILSTITPARTVTYQFNGVMESQQFLNQTATSTGAPTPFSSAEFAYGANTRLPAALSGIYGNVAQDKADPGANAWWFQTLFHGSVIDQLQRMCQVASDAPTAVATADLKTNNMFWISSYSVVHTLHNPMSTPVYVYRYEIVPRMNLKNVTDLLYTQQHRTGSGDNLVSAFDPSSVVVASDRTWVTPDVNPNEFPLFKARFRIMRKRKFTLQPGQTIYVPFAGKMNRKIDMNDYNQKRIQVKPDSYAFSDLTEWGTDATFMAKGLTKILAYQAFGIPAVQGTTGNTSVGSNVSNRVTSTPAQLIIRAITKYRVHGAVDTARRYATFKLNDNFETATSAVSGQPFNSTHAITVTNQI